MSEQSTNARRVIAGWLLWAMILLSLLDAVLPHGMFSAMGTLSGLVAGVAVLLLLPDVRKLLFVQALVLVFIGIVLMILAGQNGEPISWLDSLSRNTVLLSMVVAVGLLRLVMLDLIDPESPLPVGKWAYAKTLIAVTLFGSIINISGPILIADRLTAIKKLDLFTASGITRSFCACSAWSPFFGGMAVVLLYTETANLPTLMLHGLPYTLLSLCVVYYAGIIRHADEVELFQGYPLGLQSLAAPVVMSLLVLIGYWQFPQLSILVVITAASIALPLVYLLARKGPSTTVDRFRQHIDTEFCKSQNELLLFMAAGILASGLSHYLNSVDISLPVQSFGVREAAILLAAMIVVSVMGVHPVIQIAVLTPLLLPVSPPINLLAMVYLFSWALGTCSSPLSGTNLVIQGRYGLSSWQGAMRNWPYVAVMYWVAVAILYWVSTTTATTTIAPSN